MHDETGALGIVTELDVPVEVRDGTTLRANVFRPDDDRKHPGLLLRTPYGKPAAGFDRYVRSGYAVVTQDSRGRYASDGDYVPFTVEHTGDAEDGYDSVEWLADQEYCNGKVGTFGVSYNAWMQWQLAKLRPPHLKAMCAYSIPIELTEVDWPGAFRPGRRIRWWMTTIAPDLRRRAGLSPPHTPEEATTIWDDIENGRWLGHMPWLDIPKHLPPGLAEHAKDWLRHPSRRPWGFADVHQDIDIPNLDFSGYYDHCNGTMGHLGLMQTGARTEVARTQTKLVIGPWTHCDLGRRKIGEVDFGPQAELDLEHAIIRWFDHRLQGIDNGVDREPAVRYFVMGSGQWRSAASWPPESMHETTFHLARTEGACTLSPNHPEDSAAASEYTYDPADPVPTLWTRQLFTEPSDRRRLDYRTDILRFRTQPLAAQVEAVGYPEVVLHASSSAPDTDFFARLVDEHPDGGIALEVSYGMVRARHRHSPEREELITPGEIVEFRIRLGATACRFRKGHRIRLEITSSDFPNYDRNHNTGGNDLAETELVVAMQTIHHSPTYPSHLILHSVD